MDDDEGGILPDPAEKFEELLTRWLVKKISVEFGFPDKCLTLILTHWLLKVASI